uniref:Non-haem dioxygenase N-terminal domain-containing protein n=1 Tax=Nelumbo nucifera TaxID=4432 RepID=A0A822Z2I3_NELNU|nr:TPA_asm: hypothetical protein HUJ06_008286 [Nelumbo nucifera]
MAPQQQSLGSSLLVPCVQELAKQHPTTVPPRYLHPDQDSPNISNTDLISTIPVIDLQSLLSGESMDSELANLHAACKDWGFFQLVNHGVNPSLVEKIKLEIQELFNLPMEEKKKFWQFPGEVEGFGQAFVVSEDQKLDWADIFSMLTLPIHRRKPHLFPKLPLPLRSLSLNFYLLYFIHLDYLQQSKYFSAQRHIGFLQEMKRLAMNILELMAKALKV